MLFVITEFHQRFMMIWVPCTQVLERSLYVEWSYKSIWLVATIDPTSAIIFQWHFSMLSLTAGVFNCHSFWFVCFCFYSWIDLLDHVCAQHTLFLVFILEPCQMCSHGVDLLEIQEIQPWGRVNQDLVLDWDMDLDLNHSLVIFKLIMPLMHFSRGLSILASATLLHEIHRPRRLQNSTVFL